MVRLGLYIGPVGPIWLDAVMYAIPPVHSAGPPDRFKYACRVEDLQDDSAEPLVDSAGPPARFSE